MKSVLFKLAVVALVVVSTELGVQSTAAVQPGASTQVIEHPAPDRIMTEGEIKVMEQHLKDFGFDPGPVDGIFTAQTQDAVRAFQARYGLPVSGLLDRSTRRELVPGLDIEPRQ